MSVIKIHTGSTQLEKDENELQKRVPFLGSTLNEGFLEGHKILKPINRGSSLPEPASIIKAAPNTRLVVGLTGVSCGGKTTMANALKNWLTPEFCDVIMQDNHYRPVKELPINEVSNFPEFDEPESVRMDQIVEKIRIWKNESEDEDAKPKILVVEGTMIFTCPEIIELCDLRYLIHVDFKVARYRRSLRNYPIPDPPKIMELNIWPKYIKHRKTSKQLAKNGGHIFKQIDGTHVVEHILAGIIEDVAVADHI
jgi:uridine kinase